MSDIPRVIVYCNPGEYDLVGRAVRYIQEPGYKFPEDGWTILTFTDPFKREPDSLFAVRKNKSGFTVYSQQRNASPP